MTTQRSDSAAAASTKSPIEQGVLQARECLGQQRYAEALSITETLLPQVPENRDLLYMAAVSQRCMGRVADALHTLLRLESLHPHYGRLYQERGHCYRTVGENNTAIECYSQAVMRNPTLHASWSGLADLEHARGNTTEAQIAANHVAAIAKLPREVTYATNEFHEGDVTTAEHVIRMFLQKNGNHIEAMRLLAQIGIKHDVLDDAEFLLESILVYSPDYYAVRLEYATVLSKRHKYARALDECQRLLKIDRAHRGYRAAHANALVGMGRHEEALIVYQQMVTEAPNAPDLHLSVAHSHKTLGQQEKAIASYRQAAKVYPGFGDAYWSLANLKTYRFSDAEMAAMREHEADPSGRLVDRYHLCFALGKALEDREQYAESFACYARGNALKLTEVRYQASFVEHLVDRQLALASRDFFDARKQVGIKNPDPIFIVGLPRAGSTLLEQILASHSQVEGTMELADIPRLVHQLQDRHQTDASPRYPGILAELTPEHYVAFGEKYLKDTRVFRTGKPFFIDKMPNNFRHIGLIHLMLPNAKIIDARRDPMACCFSNFKQLFASGQEFTYSLADIGRYYRDYVRLMQHWDTVLPNTVLRVQHEDVVNDLDGSVRRILEYCGLPFESACLEFHKNERSVRTASSEQVRQPIYRDGLDQWRHFEPWLGPLRAALGPLAG
jgi:tetratricopeptide (TPR) repeat protein